MVRAFFFAFAATVLAVSAAAADTQRLTPPQGRALRVAFVVTDGANVMDIAGPWETFQDVMLSGPLGTMNHPFELFMVSERKSEVQLTGGMVAVPRFTFDDAAAADIIVVGAQRGSDKLTPWLQAQYAQGRIVMSVCTGAFKLANAGLLDGKRATTHHDFHKSFAEKFPKVTLVPGNRFVQSDARIFTAGGLTSGVDLALHIVAAYFGDKVAANTATYMEYSGQGWRHPEGASPVAAN
jgi:transcriptional regulator GlxA family with amidase domain